ncbi:Phenazine biosynthesis protein [gamma proteobacterium IMCC1989]|nr:Phenazine biosynthesis protein [gamma proteobacterium IMCC1989]
MKLSVSFIDAFTDAVFEGNPAAVIQLTEWLPEQTMQNIAAENNLSETAFVVPSDLEGSVNESTIFSIRWFSPIQEIPFCGHATLASSFFLFSRYHDVSELHFFAEAVGEFVVEKMNDATIRMNFPNRMPEKVNDIPDALIKGLSIAPDEVYRNQQAYIAIYKNEQSIKEMTTNNEVLKTLAPYNVSVTSRSTLYDFVSRYFWPASGGDEDPVTGSMHTALAPLWAERLGKNRLLAYQASKRGGELLCEVQGDRVFVSGKAVLYLEGTITINE